jgi:hypothetical protein
MDHSFSEFLASSRLIARLFLACAAILLDDMVSLVPPVASSRCKCGRATSHIHYSSNHDFFVKLGLICFLFVEGLSFVSGWVKGSTLLYLTSDEQICYEAVTRFAGTLLAPYERLSNAAMALEALSLFLAIVAVSTLHSPSENKASLQSRSLGSVRGSPCLIGSQRILRSDDGPSAAWAPRFGVLRVRFSVHRYPRHCNTGPTAIQRYLWILGVSQL